jgi:hypothetical protein
MQDFTGIFDVLFFVRTTENLSENQFAVKSLFHFFVTGEAKCNEIDIKTVVAEDNTEE